MSRARRCLLLTCSLLTGAAALLACSCADPPPPRPSPAAPALADEPPDDFAIGVTVLPPREGSAGPAPDARYLRPARYVVQSDWVLHAAVGPDAPPFPPRVRQLTHDQVRRLWWDLRDSGLLREDHPDQIGSEEHARRRVRTTYVVYFAADGVRRTLDVDPFEGPDAASVRRIVDRLASLSWEN